ncbi:MAG: Fe-S protein assembly co-chaperone HscB [Pseudomonadota bacterium]|nr:Fe-S protein assembly co-chaperone HscB [Pseudomonadota bacterium]
MNLSDDDFTLYGLPARQALDRDALDARRRDLQARVHPDRFASEGAAAQRVAMQWAVRVNEAYQRLKDPLSRAAYLCEQRGVPIDAERNTAMSAEFLMQQMQWREALDDAADTADGTAVQALQTQVERDQAAMFADVARLLDDENDAVAAAAQVRALMFVARFQRDVDQRLDALDAPVH